MFPSLCLCIAAFAAAPYAIEVDGFTRLPPRGQELFEVVAGEEFCGCDSALTLLGCLKQRPKCALAGDLAGVLTRAVQSGAGKSHISTFFSQSVLGPFCSPPQKLEVGDAPRKGPAAAATAVVEFFDYRCSHCRTAAPHVQEAMGRAGKASSLTLMPVALVENSPSVVAGEAALAAHAQGKFWAMHDKLFAQQEASFTAEGVRKTAKAAGLNVARFDAELKSGRPAKQLAQYRKHFVELGLDGTPAMFVDGRRYDLELGVYDLDARLLLERHRDDANCR